MECGEAISFRNVNTAPPQSELFAVASTPWAQLRIKRESSTITRSMYVLLFPFGCQIHSGSLRNTKAADKVLWQYRQ